MDSSRNLGSESMSSPSGTTGEVLASGNTASLPPPPPATTQEDQVSAKKPSLLLQQRPLATRPSVRVVGAINGRWFSFSGFGFGGKNSPAREATRSAFRQLKGKKNEAKEDVAGRDLWPASRASSLLHLLLRV